MAGLQCDKLEEKQWNKMRPSPDSQGYGISTVPNERMELGWTTMNENNHRENAVAGLALSLSRCEKADV